MPDDASSAPTPPSGHPGRGMPPPRPDDAAASRPDAPPGPEEPAAEIPGHRVVLGLFLVLALCVVFIFTVFAALVRPEDRHWLPELTARYLYMPVVATSILVSIDAYRRRRSGWWIYLVTAPVPGVNVALAAAWLLRWRHAPRRLGRLAM